MTEETPIIMRTVFGEKTSEIETWRLRRTIEGTSVRDRGTSPVTVNEDVDSCESRGWPLPSIKKNFFFNLRVFIKE